MKNKNISFVKVFVILTYQIGDPTEIIQNRIALFQKRVAVFYWI